MKLVPGGERMSRAILGYVYARAGRREEALNVLDGFTNLHEELNQVVLLRVAALCAALEERDRAFALLQQACDERFAMMIYLKAYPYFENLHSDPRFAELVRRIGLAP